jgi:hypothetical protein
MACVWAQDLGLDEQFAEGRMGGIGCHRVQHHFGVVVASDLPRFARMIGQREATKPRLHPPAETLISECVSMSCRLAAEFGPALAEDGFVVRARLPRGLISVGPATYRWPGPANK